MSEEKIVLGQEDLYTPEIDKRLEEDAKIEAQRAGLQGALPIGEAERPGSVWLNTMLYLAIAGLCFGFIGWGAGEVYHLEKEQLVKDRIASEHRRLIREDVPKAEARRVLRSRVQREIRAGSAIWFGVVGLFLGLGLGAAEGVVMRVPRKAVIEGLVGMAVGCVGGLVAGYVGQVVYSSIFTDHEDELFNQARIVGWAIAGGFLGVAQGAARMVPKKTLFGLIGGLIGGALGGMLFDPVASAAKADWISRLMGICAVGAGVGFFVGLVENLAKDAWIRVAAGRLSGKQFIAYRNPTVIGSDVSCDVFLFRDESVARQHAAIWKSGSGFEIEDLTTGGGTLVNNIPVKRAKLRAGDQIRIGGNLLIFEEKERRRVR
jgi:hypothetical protein